MKKVLVFFTVSALLLLVAAPAFAGHKAGHEPKGNQGGNTPSCQDGKGNHPKKNSQNKHCYPPSTSSSSSSGQNASFTTEAPQSAGLTVGMAAIVAVGALGALLLVRRRWMFRTARR